MMTEFSFLGELSLERIVKKSCVLVKMGSQELKIIIQQGLLKLIKVTLKNCIMLENNYFNKCCPFDQQILKNEGFHKNIKQQNYFQN